MSLGRDILLCNQSREAARFALKAHKMSLSPFGLFRGEAFLFQKALNDLAPDLTSPLAFCSGDAHFENIGAYSAAPGQSFVDITDFDEAHLSFAWLDLLRLCSSLELALEARGFFPPTREEVLLCAIESFREALIEGRALWLDSFCAKGLLKALAQRSEELFAEDQIQRKTKIKNGRLVLLQDSKTLDALPGSARRARALLADFSRRSGQSAVLLDAKSRVSGLGSLGLERFALLVRGPEGLLRADLKQAGPGRFSFFKHAPIQPRFSCAGERVSAIQKLMQPLEPAFFGFARLGSDSHTAKPLFSSSLRLSFSQWEDSESSVFETARQWGQICAWGHLRASGRFGAPAAQELMLWARRAFPARRILKSALAMSEAFNRLHLLARKDPDLAPWIEQGARRAKFLSKEGWLGPAKI